VSPTDEQAAVIEAQDGTVLVLAAVGSGKTSTLALRVHRALARGVAPERVLALTFTNRAAGHLREGLARAVGADVAARVVVSTFHALCSQILHAEAESIELSADFRVLDEEDVTELLRELGEAAPTTAMHRIHGDAAAVPPGEATVEQWSTGAFSDHPTSARYAAALAARGALDFAGLVLLTRAMLTREEGPRSRWSRRFESIVVDEVQDTHLSEYEVLRVLAAEARALCLVGDLDQTIYGWRGSAPHALLRAVEADFGPVRRLLLTACFRSTEAILAVADALGGHMLRRTSVVRPAVGAARGEPPTRSQHPTAREEQDDIAARCAAAIEAGEDPAEIAVLVRTHSQLAEVGAALARRGVPAATMEAFQFFRRQEVKDALALARLVHDPRDENAARRVTRRLVKGVSAESVDRLVLAGRPIGLSLADLLDERVIRSGDPLQGLRTEDVIILDTETTGLDPGQDDVIEVAALRLRGGRWNQDPADCFTALLRTDQPLGASSAVHGITAERLAAEGKPREAVFRALAAFIGDAPIAGHNITFDTRMLRAGASRLGLPLRLDVAFDTLVDARRLIAAPRYKLGILIERLGIPFIPTHRALDDVLATAALSAVLRERAAPGRAARAAMLFQQAPAFARLRETLARWAALDLRPPALVERIIEELLRHKYPGEPERLTHLSTLVQRLRRLDDPSLPAAVALGHVLDRVALSKDGDGREDNAGVRTLTMHQSKGLEFNRVFLPGIVEGGVPSYFAVREGKDEDIDEERRLLYVAMTRARHHLHLSWAERDSRGRSQVPSRFLAEATPAPAERAAAERG
jgi:DNA helicase-2/ATP-dependent DNA helicase PcrA